MEHLLFKATLAAAVLTFLIILFTRKENSYLGTTGAAGTKKLMVVDQTSGEISFLNDSVEGVNQKFLQNDATQAELLQSLFGPDLDGTAGIFKTKMEEMISNHTKITTLEATQVQWNAFTGGSTGTEMRTALDSKVYNGAKIALTPEGQNGCTGGKGCRSVVNFKQQDKSEGSIEQGWKKLDAHFGHGVGGKIRIYMNNS